MTSLAGATQDEVRRSNLALVLTMLHRHGPRSRSQIVASTGLNRSTVGDLVSELVALGLARESAGVGQGVGRPSLVVEPVAGAAVVVALDIRVERSVASLYGLGGELLARHERRHHQPSFTTLVRHVAELTQRVLARAPAGAAWVGTGVGVPGVVRTEDGLVRFAPNLGWVDVPLGNDLSEALSQRSGWSPPLQVRNDADLGARAEHLRGSGRGADTLVFLTGDIGIGGGMLVDGRPLTGAGGYGGEFGHMRVNPRGVICRCGARGCWETEIGRLALMRNAGVDEDTEVSVLLQEAESGNRQAMAAIERVAGWLGVGLANLVNIVNPQVVVLGGHLHHVYSAAGPRVDREVGRALTAAREQVRVTVTDLGGDATLIGAGELAFASLLEDPVGILAACERAS